MVHRGQWQKINYRPHSVQRPHWRAVFLIYELLARFLLFAIQITRSTVSITKASVSMCACERQRIRSTAIILGLLLEVKLQPFLTFSSGRRWLTNIMLQPLNPQETDIIEDDGLSSELVQYKQGENLCLHQQLTLILYSSNPVPTHYNYRATQLLICSPRTAMMVITTTWTDIT